MTMQGGAATMGRVKPQEFAQRLGETFAVLQHGMDLGVEWALKKVSTLQEAQHKEERELRQKLAEHGAQGTPSSEQQPSFIGRALHGASTFFQMLTAIGETYYKRYGEIKKDTAQDAQNR